MPGVMDSWTNELTKLRAWGHTMLSSGSSQIDEAGQSEKVGSKSPTIFEFMRLNSPVKVNYSEATVCMMVECFNP
ncbi:hypothetical protein DCAR_0624085 [Daucus carota subsp. sativus]|uniref:Uncharacterized protein n=1 Tax=Daucus carota subsp. sativus TaxID=79200 RepID=A0A164VM50_DAUCS|nr:hypothetical protein DCAR_0624085 [Daucus carota subsp. sativus]